MPDPRLPARSLAPLAALLAGPLPAVLAPLALAAWAWPRAPWVAVAAAGMAAAAAPVAVRWLYRRHWRPPPRGTTTK